MSRTQAQGDVDADGYERQELSAVDIRVDAGVRDAITTLPWSTLLERRYREIRSVVVPARDILGPSAEELPDEWLPGEERDLLTAISESSSSSLLSDAATHWPGPEDFALPEVIGTGEVADAVRSLVSEYKHLFRKTVARDPCDVPPMND